MVLLSLLFLLCAQYSMQVWCNHLWNTTIKHNIWRVDGVVATHTEWFLCMYSTVKQKKKSLNHLLVYKEQEAEWMDDDNDGVKKFLVVSKRERERASESGWNCACLFGSLTKVWLCRYMSTLCTHYGMHDTQFFMRKKNGMCLCVRTVSSNVVCINVGNAHAHHIIFSTLTFPKHMA